MKSSNRYELNVIIAKDNPYILSVKIINAKTKKIVMVSFICLYNKGTIKALVSTDIFRAVVASIPLGTINT